MSCFMPLCFLFMAIKNQALVLSSQNRGHLQWVIEDSKSQTAVWKKPSDPLAHIHLRYPRQDPRSNFTPRDTELCAVGRAGQIVQTSYCVWATLFFATHSVFAFMEVNFHLESKKKTLCLLRH